MKTFKKMILMPADTKVDSKQLLLPINERKLTQLDIDMKNILTQTNLSNDKKLFLYNRTLQDYINLHSKLSKPQTVMKPYNNYSHSEMDSTAASDIEFSPHNVLAGPARQTRYLSSGSSFDSLPDDDSIPFRTSTPIESLPSVDDTSIINPQNGSLQDEVLQSLVVNDEEILNDVIRSISKHPDILTYNKDTQEIVYKGKTIPNTNINDILTNHLYGAQMMDRRNYHLPEGSEVFKAALAELANYDNAQPIEHSNILQPMRIQRRLNKNNSQRVPNLSQRKRKISSQDILMNKKLRVQYPKRDHINSLGLQRNRKLLHANRKRNISHVEGVGYKTMRLHERPKRKFNQFQPTVRFFPNKKQKMFDDRNKRKLDEFQPNAIYFPNKKQKFFDAKYIRDAKALSDIKRKWIKI